MNFMKIREKHYKKFLGEALPVVAHSTDLDKPVHIDIYVFPPNEQREVTTLITGGMSDLSQPQHIPWQMKGHISTRTEIVMYADNPKRWMFTTMKWIAEYPFVKNTFIHYGHTIQNAVARSSGNKNFPNIILSSALHEDPQFNELKLSGEKVDFLVAIPITEKERKFAEKYGSDELSKRFHQRVSLIVDEKRKSII